MKREMNAEFMTSFLYNIHDAANAPIRQAIPRERSSTREQDRICLSFGPQLYAADFAADGLGQLIQKLDLPWILIWCCNTFAMLLQFVA